MILSLSPSISSVSRTMEGEQLDKLTRFGHHQGVALKVSAYQYADEAEVMAAKGYNQRDVLQAEVQKAYAEGIGNMNISGSGGAVAGDMIGMGVGLAAAGAISGQMGDMFKGITTPSQPVPVQPAAAAVCPDCGNALPDNAKFCLNCGKKIETLAEDETLCPACGVKTKKGKFCIECGASLVAKCPACGAELPSGAKFCLECGQKL